MSMYDYTAQVVIATLRSALFEGYVLTPTDYSRGAVTPQVSYLQHSGLLRDILNRAVEENKLVELMTLLDDLGIFKMWSLMTHTPQNPEYHPEGSVAAHMYMVLNVTHDYSPVVKLCALMHDFGKPTSYIEHGNTHDHHVSGLPYIEAFCDLFDLCTEIRELSTTICRYHIRAHQARELSAAKLLGLLEVLRYQDDEYWSLCMDIFRCDLLGRGGTTNTNSIDYLATVKDTLQAHAEYPELSRRSELTILKRFIRTHKEGVTPTELPLLPLNKHLDTDRRDWLMEQVNLQRLDVVAIVIVGSVNQRLATADSDLDVVCVYKPGIFSTAVTERPKSVDLKMELQFKSVTSLPDNLGKSDHNTLDLLYAPNDCLLYSTQLWDSLCKHRSHAVAADMYGLTAGLNKLWYSIHGRDEELAVLYMVTDALGAPSVNNLHQLVRYVSSPKVYLASPEGRKPELLYVLGKSYRSGIQSTVLRELILQRRIKLEKLTQRPIDTKETVHAIRAAYAYLELLDTGGESMALDVATIEHLIKLKQGQLIDSVPNTVLELRKELDYASALALNSGLRTKPDVDLFKTLIKEI